MKVRLISGRWDQPTPKGIVKRRRGDQFSVKDDVAEWLIRSGAAEPAGRAPSSAPREPNAATAAVDTDPDSPEDVIEDLDDEQDEDGGDEEAPAPAVERPAQAAPKADWVAYAASKGIPAKEAESMDKQTLISRTG